MTAASPIAFLAPSAIAAALRDDLAAARADRLILVRTVVEADVVVRAALALPVPLPTRVDAPRVVVRCIHSRRAVFADVPRLVRALALLVYEARAVAPAQSVVTVTTSDDPGTGHVRFGVKDEGPGITMQRYVQILRRPSAASVHLARPHGLTADSDLALIYARTIAEWHGGRIGVASVPGCTRVWFDIPSSWTTLR